MRGKLLWIGDAVCQSGFGKATHETLEELRKHWEISVLGLNYRGDPDGRRYPYDIYPAHTGGDLFGIRRLKELTRKITPDVVVVQNDPWNFPMYMKHLESLPVVGIVAVDGKNCQGRNLNGLKCAVFWTDFGMQEARAGGYTGPAAVVPLGVDLETFKPLPRRESRKLLGFPAHTLDAFVVGNVNRNQPRKRLDLTIQYFANWIKRNKIGNAYLFLHVAPTGDSGVDCRQLAVYHGVANRLILVEPEIWNGVTEDRLAATYSSFDVMISTTQGEGWGLTTMEGMACGIPQIVPDWAALGEWPRDCAALVPCTSNIVTMDGINVVGGVADERLMVDTLHEFYSDNKLCDQYAHRGLSLVQQPQYRWENIAKAFSEVVDEVMEVPNVEQLQATSG